VEQLKVQVGDIDLKKYTEDFNKLIEKKIKEMQIEDWENEDEDEEGSEEYGSELEDDVDVNTIVNKRFNKKKTNKDNKTKVAKKNTIDVFNEDEEEEDF